MISGMCREREWEYELVGKPELCAHSLKKIYAYQESRKDTFSTVLISKWTFEAYPELLVLYSIGGQ